MLAGISGGKKKNATKRPHIASPFFLFFFFFMLLKWFYRLEYCKLLMEATGFTPTGEVTAAQCESV